MCRSQGRREAFGGPGTKLRRGPLRAKRAEERTPLESFFHHALRISLTCISEHFLRWKCSKSYLMRPPGHRGKLPPLPTPTLGGPSISGWIAAMLMGGNREERFVLGKSAPSPMEISIAHLYFRMNSRCLWQKKAVETLNKTYAPI